MRTAILVGGFFLISPAFAISTKLDLRERIQFSRNSENGVTFEYCKLKSCEKLNSRPIDQKVLISISDPINLPSGVANQILMDAGINAEKNRESFQYGIAGVVTGAGEISRAICNEKELKDIISNAKIETDYVLKYEIKKCTRNSATLSMSEEAAMLKKILKP